MSVLSKDPGVVHADAWGSEGAVLARLSFTGLGLRDLAADPRIERGWTWAHDLAVATPFLRLVSRAQSADSMVPADDTDLMDLVAVLASRSDRRPPARGGWFMRPRRWHGLPAPDSRLGLEPRYGTGSQ